MAGTIVGSTKTNHGEITLDLSAAAGPAAEERQGGDQEDRRTGRQTERGKGRGGGDSGRDVPSRRISPFTLLSYEGGYHSRWPQGRFFFLFSLLPSQLRWDPGEGWSDERLDGGRGR